MHRGQDPESGARTWPEHSSVGNTFSEEEQFIDSESEHVLAGQSEARIHHVRIVTKSNVPRWKMHSLPKNVGAMSGAWTSDYVRGGVKLLSM